jgi:DNA topoisomerase VI subunit B
MEFFTEKELTMQMGCGRLSWPLALLKELIDNCLDACEKEAAPPSIVVKVEDDAFVVVDSGPGLPESTLRKSLDYTVRVSDKSYHVSPTRGQLGNALKCVWAAPFVVDGHKGKVEVSTSGQKHTVEVALDQIARKPKLELSSEPFDIKIGTKIKVHWPSVASYQRFINTPNFYDDAFLLIHAFHYFNPHAAFHICDHPTAGEEFSWESVDRPFKKWTANKPTSAWCMGRISWPI